MDDHDPPCQPLKDIDTKLNGKLDEINRKIGCFEGKFDMLFQYQMPKKFHHVTIDADNSEDLKKAVDTDKFYKFIIKYMMVVIVVMGSLLGGTYLIGG